MNNSRLDYEDAQPTEYGAWLAWVTAVMAIGALVGYVLLAAVPGGW